MSKTWEHHHHADSHHQQAAYHVKEVERYHQEEEREKAACRAYLAHDYNQPPIHRDSEAAKLHAKKRNGSATSVTEQGSKEKSAG